MPGRGTPLQCIRLPEEAWKTFGEIARSAGTTRAAVLREFIAWYSREQGARLPRRPGSGYEA